MQERLTRKVLNDNNLIEPEVCFHLNMQSNHFNRASLCLIYVSQ